MKKFLFLAVLALGVMAITSCGGEPRKASREYPDLDVKVDLSKTPTPLTDEEVVNLDLKALCKKTSEYEDLYICYKDFYIITDWADYVQGIRLYGTKGGDNKSEIDIMCPEVVEFLQTGLRKNDILHLHWEADLYYYSDGAKAGSGQTATKSLHYIKRVKL